MSPLTRQDSAQAPLLSIVTIVRNNKSVLETLASLAKQTANDWELLVVDGCSTDGTSELLASFLSEHAMPARHIREPDTGISDALNKGVRLACGEWLLFLNGGDSLHSDTSLAEILSLLRNSRSDVVCGAASMEGQEKQFLSHGNWRLLDDPAYFWNPVCHQATFFRREWHSKFLYDARLRYTMDLDVLLRMRRAGGTFETIPRIICRYRLGGLTSSDAHYWKNHAEHDLVNRRNGRIPPLGWSNLLLMRNLASRFLRMVFGSAITRVVRKRLGRA